MHIYAEMGSCICLNLRVGGSCGALDVYRVKLEPYECMLINICPGDQTVTATATMRVWAEEGRGMERSRREGLANKSIELAYCTL